MTTEQNKSPPQHTPGPWFAARVPRSHFFRITTTPDNANGDIANVLDNLVTRYSGTIAGNANLIAAAPDGFALAELIVRCRSQGHPIHDDIVNAAQAFLAKARGQA